MPGTVPRSLVRAAVLVAVALVYWGYDQYQARSSVPAENQDRTAQVSVGEVEGAFAARRSDVLVQVAGTVDRVLSDDHEGSRHQRFIVRLASGHTVLVAHNIDLAERVPLRRGDAVEIKGEYEWNDRGGVVHWTHRDPRRRHEDGWIRHQGSKYG